MQRRGQKKILVEKMKGNPTTNLAKHQTQKALIRVYAKKIAVEQYNATFHGNGSAYLLALKCRARS